MKKVYEQPILNIEVLEDKNIFLAVSFETEGAGNTASYNQLF